MPRRAWTPNHDWGKGLCLVTTPEWSWPRSVQPRPLGGATLAKSKGLTGWTGLAPARWVSGPYYANGVTGKKPMPWLRPTTAYTLCVRTVLGRTGLSVENTQIRVWSNSYFSRYLIDFGKDANALSGNTQFWDGTTGYGTNYANPGWTRWPVEVIVFGSWASGAKLQFRAYTVPEGFFNLWESTSTVTTTLSGGASWVTSVAGAYNGDTGQWESNPTGLVAGVAVWDRALDPVEMAAIAKRPGALFDPPRRRIPPLFSSVDEDRPSQTDHLLLAQGDAPYLAKLGNLSTPDAGRVRVELDAGWTP